jgi:pimeloyl-ACP methyl ester carboxylesterase
MVVKNLNQGGGMKFIGLVLIVSIVMLVGLRLFSRKLLYFPTPVSRSQLAHVKKSFTRVKEITIPMEEKGILHGWLIQKDMKNLPTIFYFGGNAEEVSLNMDDFVQNLEANVVMVNYRGFGLSHGTPTEDGLKSDALVIYDALAEKYGITPVDAVAWGRSIGSSVASFLALKRGLSRLILTCPFDSIESVAANYYPKWLVGMVLKDTHRTIDFSSQIGAATLVLASKKDEVIPLENTLNLYESLNCPKQLVYIEGAGHNTISEFTEYYRVVNQFLD